MHVDNLNVSYESHSHPLTNIKTISSISRCTALKWIVLLAFYMYLYTIALLAGGIPSQTYAPTVAWDQLMYNHAHTGEKLFSLCNM